ncbi:MAG TPA: hypothetical protein VM307_07880 [Egibacteraceae bacterium]|nr:hypothetical protein [Egibacteraceae bacterium]
MTNIARAVLGGFLILAAAQLFAAFGVGYGSVIPPVVGLVGLAIGLWGCVGPDRT